MKKSIESRLKNYVDKPFGKFDIIKSPLKIYDTIFINSKDAEYKIFNKCENDYVNLLYSNYYNGNSLYAGNRYEIDGINLKIICKKCSLNSRYFEIVQREILNSVLLVNIAGIDNIHVQFVDFLNNIEIKEFYSPVVLSSVAIKRIFLDAMISFDVSVFKYSKNVYDEIVDGLQVRIEFLGFSYCMQ